MSKKTASVAELLALTDFGCSDPFLLLPGHISDLYRGLSIEAVPEWRVKERKCAATGQRFARLIGARFFDLTGLSCGYYGVLQLMNCDVIQGSPLSRELVSYFAQETF